MIHLKAEILHPILIQIGIEFWGMLRKSIFFILSIWGFGFWCFVMILIYVLLCKNNEKQQQTNETLGAS